VQTVTKFLFNCVLFSLLILRLKITAVTGFLLSCVRGTLEENMQTAVTTSPLYPRDLQFRVCN